jgi:multiple antibiotic resistance protein
VVETNRKDPGRFPENRDKSGASRLKVIFAFLAPLAAAGLAAMAFGKEIIACLVGLSGSFDRFWDAFFPLFVAFSPLGVMPMFMSMTRHMDKAKTRKILVTSLVTALSVAMGFVICGQAIFEAIGLKMGDFMIGGGALLFLIGLEGARGKGKEAVIDEDNIGIVPLAVPIIVGPAVMTMSLSVVRSHGVAVTLAVIAMNVALTGVFLYFSPQITKLLKPRGVEAFAKIYNILLLAMGVMMIRKGLEAWGVLKILSDIKGQGAMILGWPGHCLLSWSGECWDVTEIPATY